MFRIIEEFHQIVSWARCMQLGAQHIACKNWSEMDEWSEWEHNYSTIKYTTIDAHNLWMFHIHFNTHRALVLIETMCMAANLLTKCRTSLERWNKFCKQDILDRKSIIFKGPFNSNRIYAQHRLPGDMDSTNDKWQFTQKCVIHGATSCSVQNTYTWHFTWMWLTDQCICGDIWMPAKY